MKENSEIGAYGKWFKSFVDLFPQVKKKAIAQRAGISPVSLSRILNGEHGVALTTAESLMRALNELTGQNAVDIDEGLKIASGINAITRESAITTNAQKIAELLASSDLVSDFNSADFEWIAQLIEMRSLWKSRRWQQSEQSDDSTSEDYFMPDEELNLDEPPPINLEDLPAVKSKKSSTYSFSHRKKIRKK